MRETSLSPGTASGCVLALDIGEKRIGIAASDAARKVAFPVVVLDTAEVESLGRRFRLVLEDYDPALLVAGLPLSLDGVENDQALRVRRLATQIAASCGIELVYWDERLSSSEAKGILRAQGINEKKARGKVDMIAASLFLQSWLDAQNAGGRAPREGELHG